MKNNLIQVTIELFRLLFYCLFFLSIFLTKHVAFAQEESIKIPRFINPANVITAGSTVQVRTIRFLTTNDFPPFNFIDQQGSLEGFNIAMARQLCLEIKARCTMQALPWGDLKAALDNGQGDAIIAGIAKSNTSLREFSFSAPYMHLPARFFAKHKVHDFEKEFEGPAGLKVGVVRNSAHEAYLKKFFPKTKRIEFENMASLFQAILEEDVFLGFADAVSISFWLQSAASKQCCNFIGGPYINQNFFGSGMMIAVPVDRPDLKKKLDEGLARLMRGPKYSETYLRYFPINPF